MWVGKDFRREVTLKDRNVPNTEKLERHFRESTMCAIPEIWNNMTHTETSRNVAKRAGVRVGGGRGQTGAGSEAASTAGSSVRRCFQPGLHIWSPGRLQFHVALLVSNANSRPGGLESLPGAWGS